MKKWLFIIALAVLLIMPFNVSADGCGYDPNRTIIGEEGAKEYLYSKPYIKEKDGKRVVALSSISAADNYEQNYYGLSEILNYLIANKDVEAWVNPTDNKIVIRVSYNVENQNNTVQSINNIDNMVTDKMPLVGDTGGGSEPELDAPRCLFYREEFDYEFESELDTTLVEKADTLVSSFEDEYSIEDISLLNLFYNYGSLSGFGEMDDYSSLLYNFQDLKKTMLENKDFDYKVFLHQNMTRPGVSELHVYLLLTKDGKVYGIKKTVLSEKFFFRVDKDAEGTLTEKVENRIKKYYGDNVKFYLKSAPLYYYDQPTYTDYDGEVSNVSQYYLYLEKDNDAINTFYNEYCNGQDGDFCVNPFTKVSGHFSRVGDVVYRPYQALNVIEVDGSKINDLEVFSIDESTGVEITTDSYDVPLDTLLQTEDESDNEKIINLLKNYNFQIYKAYNIDMYGMKNGSNSKIKNIDKGVYVYIPVTDYNEGDDVIIRHINDDGTLGDEFVGKVVKKDGKLYARFMTNHFSTYAIVQDNTTNPDTGDNIISYVLMFILSTFGIIGTGIYLKKE